MTMLTAALPFAGFYGSQHDADLNCAVEAMFCNDLGDSCPGLTDRVSGACNWPAVHRAFAREFAEAYCEEVGSLVPGSNRWTPRRSTTSKRIACSSSFHQERHDG